MPFSAPCGGAAAVLTSGPGASSCSPRRSSRRPRPCGATTCPCTASCARPATRRSGSSTTSASTRRSPRSRPPRRPASGSSCSWLHTHAAGCRASGRSPLRSTSRRSRRCADEGSPADWLEEIGRYAAAERLPLHVHADEQPREIEECLEEHGVRPIELLERTGCLGERSTVVHATLANGAELDLLARAGARICACPTTEADLG